MKESIESGCYNVCHFDLPSGPGDAAANGHVPKTNLYEVFSITYNTKMDRH